MAWLQSIKALARRFVILGSGLLSLLAVCAGIASNAKEPPSTDKATSTQAEPSIAKNRTKPLHIKEISRHPANLPPSANYTLYEDGAYSRPVEHRHGPLMIEVHFKVQEVVAEITEGTTLEFWTFNGKIPGPMIRARSGDEIDFYLHNSKNNTFAHNVDFHAVTGPGGGAANLTTLPGSTSHIRVKLLKPGIYLYHCAAPPIPTHIEHGLYGLLVVEPRKGLRDVDHEYYLMQSEFYTALGGSKAALALKNRGHLSHSKKYGMLEEPTFVVFNGRPNAVSGNRTLGVYGDTVHVGDTIRMFIGNIGPNLISSFHVIGEHFDRVFVEGSFSLTNHDVQTTSIPSGGASGVEFKVEVPGTYILLDHSIFRINKGTVAHLKVIGPENTDVYQPLE
ncbi:MAG: nitrite reductase, copper-containing [Nitrococcus mobilis]|nr:nitrite reductase, copper-containing [Nitrococcus mobilis]